ncbi:hypothetical protein [Streptacidiphilus sp. PAMC 29251]
METSSERPDIASVLRFSTELIAWVATPWALAEHSIVLAVLSVLLLIGLPTLFGTPGDKPGRPPVAVPGIVTIALVLLQLVAAVVAAWAVWPTAAAVAVSLLAGATVVTELPRWRRLWRTPANSGGQGSVR